MIVVVVVAIAAAAAAAVATAVVAAPVVEILMGEDQDFAGSFSNRLRYFRVS